MGDEEAREPDAAAARERGEPDASDVTQPGGTDHDVIQPGVPLDPPPSVQLNKPVPIAEQQTLAGSPTPPPGAGPRPHVPPVPQAPAPPPGGSGPYGPPVGHAPPGYGSPQPMGPYAPQPMGPYGPQPGGAYPPPGYGYPAGPGGWAAPPPPGASGICTSAMVVGIVSGVMAMSVYGLVLSLILGPVALGLGISARRQVARGTAHGSGMATAGFVLGIVTTAISWLLLVVVVIALVAETR